LEQPNSSRRHGFKEKRQGKEYHISAERKGPQSDFSGPRLLEEAQLEELIPETITTFW
jgi:hypothetical protein